MRITHLGHACVLIQAASGGRVLLDPGTYSHGFEENTGLTAIAVTHQHPDHLDPERLEPLCAANPEARLLFEVETAAAIENLAVTAVSAGQEFQVGDVSIRALGGRHAVNHERVPTIGNVGLLVTADDITFFHPGDSYDEAPSGVDVLGLPLNAPWARMSETLAFLHAVSPRVAIPIHTALLSDAGMAAYLMHAQRFAPEASEVADIRPGSSYAV